MDERLNEWDEINKKVEISKIKRLPWKKILGESLTARIHKLRNKGHNSDEVYSILIRNPAVQEYCDQNPNEVQTLLENLKISVCARFGESRTAAKIKIENRDENLIAAFKHNALELAKHHRKHCEGEGCTISLYILRRMAEGNGVKFDKEEQEEFL